MILKETLRQVIKAQRVDLTKLDYGVKRELLNKIKLNVPFALILSGIRRCGKSTLLRQLIKKVNNFYYFNFEDPRVINFNVSDFHKLNEVFKEEYGESDYYFFDEIQKVQGFEKWLRTYYDKDNNMKFIIGGSNISLLAPKLSTVLTGRNITFSIYPLSFYEIKSFANISFESYLK